jgi:hypothetical protein
MENKKPGRKPLSNFGKSMTYAFRANPELLDLIKRKRALIGKKEFPGWLRLKLMEAMNK